MSSELQMASENYKKTSCESDPNFAVICAFLEKFGVPCGLSNIDFMSLQGMLENTEEVSQTLIDLHIKLLRKAKKSIKSEKWEKELIKFCYRYCCQDAWEIEKFGYRKAKLSTKIRILKELFEIQFDCNNRFKTEINKMSASELRSQPLGRDRMGYTYWFLNDCNYQIRVYKEDPENETWTLVARDKDSLLALIAELNGEEFKPTGIQNEDRNDHSLSEKASVDVEQKKTGDWFIKSDEKDNCLILALKESPSNSKETDYISEKSDISETPKDIVELQSDISEQEPKLKLKKEADHKESSSIGTAVLPDDHSNETKIGRVKLKNVSNRISELSEVTNKTLMTPGEDSGRSLGDEAHLQANPVVSEAIEEAVLYIHGEGSGQDNLTGNEDVSGSSDLKQEKSSSVHTKIQTLKDTDEPSYSDPVCSSDEISDHTCMQMDVFTSAGNFSKLGKILDTKTGIKTKFLKSAWKKSRWDVETSESSESDAVAKVSEDFSVGSVEERINEWEQLPTPENNFSSQVVCPDGNDDKLLSTNSSNIQSEDKIQYVNKELTDRNTVVDQRNTANVSEEIQESPLECSIPVINKDRKSNHFMPEIADHFSPNNILETKADGKNNLLDNASVETVTTLEDQVTTFTPHFQSASEAKMNLALKVQDDEKSGIEEIIQEESVLSPKQSNSCPADENSAPSKLTIKSQNNTVQCTNDGDVYEIVQNKKSFEIDASLKELSVNQSHVVDTVGCDSEPTESKLNSTGFQSIVDTKESSCNKIKSPFHGDYRQDVSAGKIITEPGIKDQQNELSSSTDENNKKPSSTAVNQLPLDSVINSSPTDADDMAIVDTSVQYYNASVDESTCNKFSPLFSKLPASNVQSTNALLDDTTINKDFISEKAVSNESFTDKELPCKDAGLISDGHPVKMNDTCTSLADQVHLSSELSLNLVCSGNISSDSLPSENTNNLTPDKSKSDTESLLVLSPLPGSSTGADSESKESLDSQVVHYKNDPELTNEAKTEVNNFQQATIPVENTSVDNNDQPSGDVLYRSKSSDDLASSDIVHDDIPLKPSPFGNETTTTNKSTGLIYRKDLNNALPVDSKSSNVKHFDPDCLESDSDKMNKIDINVHEKPFEISNHPADTIEKNAVEVDDPVVKTVNSDSDHVHTSVETTDRIHIACVNSTMISTDTLTLKTSDNTLEKSKNKVETSLKEKIDETCEMSVSGKRTEEKAAVEVVNAENVEMLDSPLVENISVNLQENINLNADKIPHKNAMSDISHHEVIVDEVTNAVSDIPDNIEKYHNPTVSDISENSLNAIKVEEVVLNKTAENSADDTSRSHNTELFKNDEDSSGTVSSNDTLNTHSFRCGDHSRVEQTVESFCSNDIIKSVTNVENPKNKAETESSSKNTISNEASVLEVAQNEITNEDNEIGNGSESNTFCEANVSDDSLGKHGKTNDTVDDVKYKGLMSNRELLKTSSKEKVEGNEEKQLDEISNLHTSIAAGESLPLSHKGDVTCFDDTHKVDAEPKCHTTEKPESVSSISITKTVLVNEIGTVGKTKENPSCLTEGDTIDQIGTSSYKKEENYESQIPLYASSKSQIEENVLSEQIERLEESTDGKGKHLEQIKFDEKPAQDSEHDKSEHYIKDKMKENVEPSSTSSTEEVPPCASSKSQVEENVLLEQIERLEKSTDGKGNHLEQIDVDEKPAQASEHKSEHNIIDKMKENVKPSSTSSTEEIPPYASSLLEVEENVLSEQIERLEKSTDGKGNHLEQIIVDEKPAQASEHNKSEHNIKDKMKENVEPSSNSTEERNCEITAVAVLNKSNEMISPDVEKYVEDSSDNTLSKMISGLDQEVSRRVTRRSGGSFKIQGINENEKSVKKVPERGIKQQTKSTNKQRELEPKIKKLKGKHIDISTNDFDPVVMITRTAVNKNRKTKSLTPETKVLTRSSSRFLDKRLSDTELGDRLEKKYVDKNVDTADCSTRVKKAIKCPIVKKKMGDEIIDSPKATSEKPHGEKKSRSQELNKAGNILIEPEELCKEVSENTRTLRVNKRMNNMNSKDIKSESPVAKKQKICDDSKIVKTRVTRSGRHFVELHSEHKEEAKFPLVSKKTKTLPCKTSKTSVNKNTRSSQSSSVSTPTLLPQTVPIIDCDAAVDSSSDIIEIQERDPLAVSEGESEVSRQLSSTDFNLSGNQVASSTRRSLRKRGLEHPEKVADLSESLVKKNKTKSKESASLQLEKSVEEAQNTVNISSSEDDVIIISDSNETSKIGPKKKSPSKKGKKKKGLQNRTFKAPDRENLASHNPQQTRKQIMENRNKRILLNLGIALEDMPDILGENQLAVRQSRRLAQLKIKEEAESQKFGEFTQSSQQLKSKIKQKKSTSNSEKLQKSKSNKIESANCDTIDLTIPESKEKKRRKRKKTRDPRKIFDESHPWRSSSDESSDFNEIEEEDYVVESEPDEEPLQFKSDHEFSPESDLEDPEYKPTKIARTARKASGTEKNDDCPCKKCGKSNDPEWVLLCDNCNSGWHCSCLRPPIFVIPEGDWFCPPCQHDSLVAQLREKLVEYEKKLAKKELEDRRKERLAYVGISLNNVLKNESKKKYSENDGESSSVKSISSSDSSSESDDSDEPIYQLRQRRQVHSYRFNEFDELINSAIQEEMEVAKSIGNRSGGKDIIIIEDGEKISEKKTENTNTLEPLPSSTLTCDENKHVDPVINDTPEKQIKKIIGRKKSRKLNCLDIDSEDDTYSDEDFKGPSSDQDDEIDDFTDDSENSQRNMTVSPVRRSARIKTAKYAGFFDDSFSNTRKKKKKREKQTKSDSENSDGSWDEEKRNTRSIHHFSKKRKWKKNKEKYKNYSDLESHRSRKKPKFTRRRLSSSDEDLGRRTRGKKINYADFDSDSDENKDKKTTKKSDSDEDYIESEEDIEEDKCSVKMNIKEDEKSGNSSDSTVVNKVPRLKVRVRRIIESDDENEIDHASTDLVTEKQSACNNEHETEMSKEDSEDDLNTSDETHKHVDEMNEAEVEKMMEDEEYATKQLQLVAIQIEKRRKKEERARKKFQRNNRTCRDMDLTRESVIPQNKQIEPCHQSIDTQKPSHLSVSNLKDDISQECKVKESPVKEIISPSSSQSTITQKVPCKEAASVSKIRNITGELLQEKIVSAACLQPIEQSFPLNCRDLSEHSNLINSNSLDIKLQPTQMTSRLKQHLKTKFAKASLQKFDMNVNKEKLLVDSEKTLLSDSVDNDNLSDTSSVSLLPQRNMPQELTKRKQSGSRIIQNPCSQLSPSRSNYHSALPHTSRDSSSCELPRNPYHSHIMMEPPGPSSFDMSQLGSNDIPESIPLNMTCKDKNVTKSVVLSNSSNASHDNKLVDLPTHSSSQNLSHLPTRTHLNISARQLQPVQQHPVCPKDILPVQENYYGSYPPPPSLISNQNELSLSAYQSSLYAKAFVRDEVTLNSSPDNSNNSNCKGHDEEISSEFGGLVSYFSSQREDDLDS